MTFYFFS